MSQVQTLRISDGHLVSCLFEYKGGAMPTFERDGTRHAAYTAWLRIDTIEFGRLEDYFQIKQADMREDVAKNLLTIIVKEFLKSKGYETTFQNIRP